MLVLSPKGRICSHIRAIFNPAYHTKELLEKYPSVTAYVEEIKSNEEYIKKQNISPLEFNCSMFNKYLKEKSVMAAYYGFQIHNSEEKLKEKYHSSSKPVYYIFKKLNEVAKTKVDTTLISNCEYFYKEQIGQMKEGFLSWLVPLLYILGIIPYGEIPSVPEDATAITAPWDRNRAQEKIEIDGYVEDKHTKKGRNKGILEFALEGAKVINEGVYINPVWKRFYEDSKRFEEGIAILDENYKDTVDTNKIVESTIIKKKNKPKIDILPVISCKKESEEYNFIVRTQITTSASKMDVYFAEDIDNKLVVVKGPYINKSDIETFETNMLLKRELGLPIIPYRVVELIPDRWPEKIPLRARNNLLSLTTPVQFIIFDSVISKDKIKTKMHSSKVWPETEVVDWANMDQFHFSYKVKLSDNQIKDYIEAILFRYICGISDLADRNFIISNDRVISIDEDISNKSVNIYGELKKNKAQWVYNWLKSNYEKLNINSWNNDRLSQELLLQINNKEECLKLFMPK